MRNTIQKIYIRTTNGIEYYEYKRLVIRNIRTYSCSYTSWFGIILSVLTIFTAPTIALALEVDFPELGGIKPADTFGPAQWVSYIFTFSMAAVGLAVIYAFTRGGIEWMTAGDNQSRVSDARARMKGAVLGLIILLGSYVLLNTINPDLVNLREPNFQFDPGVKIDYSKYGGSLSICTAGGCPTGEVCAKIDASGDTQEITSGIGRCIPTGVLPGSIGTGCDINHSCSDYNSRCIKSNGEIVTSSGESGICTTKVPNGAQCVRPDNCFSGNCSEGRCSSVQAAAPDLSEAVTVSNIGDDCGGNKVCDGSFGLYCDATTKKCRSRGQEGDLCRASLDCKGLGLVCGGPDNNRCVKQ